MDLVFANLPWLNLGAAWLLCLVVSALGFRRVDWFISIGYGLSIAAEAIVFSSRNAGALTPPMVRGSHGTSSHASAAHLSPANSRPPSSAARASSVA